MHTSRGNTVTSHDSHEPRRYATAKALPPTRAALLGTLLAVILLSLGAGPAAFAQDYQDWKFTHPKPQANLLRKMQMIDANTWVAVGANGTFMRTTDAGADWYFHHQAGLPDAALTIGQNYDVRFVSPTDGLVVGDKGFVGKTSDGGVTFTSVASGVPTNLLMRTPDTSLPEPQAGLQGQSLRLRTVVQPGQACTRLRALLARWWQQMC